MTDRLDAPRPRQPRPPRWPAPVRALSLLAGSALLYALLHAAHLPAAGLIGPMLAAVLLAVGPGPVRLPAPAFSLAQGIVGVMIAGHLPLSLWSEARAHGGIFVLGVLSTVGASTLMGWLLTRARVLPGTTAIWGTCPGAATAMTLMSADHGADMRLVAVMQYLRVMCCAVAAAMAAALLGGGGGGGAGVPAGVSSGVSAAVSAAHAVAAPLSLPGMAATLALAASGVLLGIRFKVPGGAMVVPMALGLAARALFGFTVQLPDAALLGGYVAIGWGIGLRFDRAALAHAARALPKVLAAILAMLGCNAVFALMLVHWAGIAPLTAFLATSPGGADSVAIIASHSPVDVPFVVSMQVGRFLLVLLLGPGLAKWVSGKAGVG